MSQTTWKTLDILRAVGWKTNPNLLSAFIKLLCNSTRVFNFNVRRLFLPPYFFVLACHELELDRFDQLLSFLHCLSSATVDKSKQHFIFRLKKIGNAKNQTWDGWVRSANATSMLCHPPFAIVRGKGHGNFLLYLIALTPKNIFFSAFLPTTVYYGFNMNWYFHNDPKSLRVECNMNHTDTIELLKGPK